MVGVDRARSTKTKTGHTLCDPEVKTGSRAATRRTPRTIPCCQTKGNSPLLCVRVGSDSAEPALLAGPTYPPVLSTISCSPETGSRRLDRATHTASIIIYPKCSKRWVTRQRVVEKADFLAFFSVSRESQPGPIYIDRQADRQKTQVRVRRAVPAVRSSQAVVR
jgi:hypothetical protein